MCSSRKIRDTGFTYDGERTLECGECGGRFEESDA